MPLNFSYKNPDGSIATVHAAPKEQIERVLGPLTDEEYRAHVLQVSIPPDAADVQELPESERSRSSSRSSGVSSSMRRNTP